MMRISEAALATQGRLLGEDVLFTSVGFDSRHLMPEQLFVALRGEHFDGHAYAGQALQAGAAVAMVDQEIASLFPCLLVKDTRLALGDLAAYWRQQFTIPVAAITGSNGKTTVKEMLAAILRVAAGSADAVLATEGNLNNDIGLPLTLLKLRSQHQYAVVEMGMNHAGEIRYITNIGRPNVALVNNAGAAHLEGLGTVEAIAQAKGEIFEGLVDNGVAVINADDKFAPLWRKLAASHPIVTFGLDVAADVTASYQLQAEYSQLQMKTPQGEVAFSLPVAGVHNIRNALAASAAALSMGVALHHVSQGLANFGGVKGRLQHKAGVNGALLIDDTYNANPASMKAAIDVLAARTGKKLLVLGDMGELGQGAAQLHAEIGSYAQQAGIDALFVLGELSQKTAQAFGADARHFATPEMLATALISLLNNHTTVLVKGSRFMRMERVVNLLQISKPAEKNPAEKNTEKNKEETH